jgi:hypothetical protein
MTKYTANDFANARFAEHPDGRLAHRVNRPDGGSWAIEDLNGNRDRVNENYMARKGWVPVPTKHTITRSRYQILMRYENAHYQGGFNDALTEFGIEMVDDPEPTDEELLAGIIRNIDDWQSITSPELLAKYLNTAGVTAPNTKGN